jgi:hypothetical protein
MPLRTPQPLPRYVRRKFLKTKQWSYFFEVPTWAKKAGCELQNQALGSDYQIAFRQAVTVLLPAFDSWRTSGESDLVPPPVAPGTLNWLFAEYRKSSRAAEVSARMMRIHENGFTLVGKHVMKDGREVGSVNLKSITSAAVDAIFDKLLFVIEKNEAGDEVRRERRTTVNHAMKSCRRAWNVVARAHPHLVPANPFSKMGLKSRSKPTPTATYDELQQFRKAAKSAGRASLATAALFHWEITAHGVSVLDRLMVEHYRPRERPDAIFIAQEKSGDSYWYPLSDRAGRPLFPELAKELDALCKDRIGGHLFRRDGTTKPWYTSKGDRSYFIHEVKKVIREAGLRDELTFTSFRHGGITEAADSGLTDAEIRAISRHTSSKVLPRYAKKTLEQVAEATSKRRAARTKRGHLSE